jgi:hypothetical protein
MRTDLKRRKLLFKAKMQLVNNSIIQRGVERHNTNIDERKHSGDAKIADLVREHLQTKEKTRMGGGR